MKKCILIFLSLIFLGSAMAQNYWSAHTGTAKMATAKAVARKSFPTNFKLFDLKADLLKQDLFTVIDNISKHSIIVSVPNAKGALEKFEITEASNFDKKLQARFPLIRAFSGRGITDKAATIKLSYSPQGVSGMIFRNETQNEFIESYSADHTTYAVYTSERSKGNLPWTCSTEDVGIINSIGTELKSQGNVTARSGANLKTLRLAQSVTAEYSNYFGAASASQVSLVLAGINATLTRCNGVYEKDLALHLNMIDASTNVIYYNASTDPYSPASTGAGGRWNSELQNTLTSVIGEANYDIGHLFGASGGGGNAGCIGCVCTNGSKGSGFTSPADAIPEGDNFDIDYVVHEVGHQLGANHTFSYSNEGTGQNKEIGSGITIMGYAGITSQDVAPHSIDIYHETSIAQIQSNITSKTCPVTSTIVNSTPVVNSVSNYTIPISTPFALTGSATDADAGDVLTYCWEEDDNGSSSQTGNSSRASATKASGPNWISWPATTSPTRYFPKLSTILAGGTTTGPLTGGDANVLIEALSSVSRTLKFRLTVRDNATYSSTAPISVGQTNFTDMTVTVSNTSGPFSITAPNTAVSYVGGSSQTVTWNVASTTVSPVSCANVKISLSTDGGQTFPTVLIASTPNDGSQAVTIPNTPTTTARIKVEAVGNIFFDLSNANFTITSGSSCGTPTSLASSAITTSEATVSWAAVSGANSYAVDYKLNSSATWTSFSTAQTATSANLTGLASSSLYDWRVIATCTSGTSAAASAQFTTLTPCTAPTSLASSSVTSSSATVSWAAVTGATSYAVDYKLNSSATWTSFSTAQTTTSSNLTGLTASSLYDWRVSATCASGTTAFSSAQFTTTAMAACNAPTGLSSTVTSSSATVSWTAVSGAVSYAVDYKLNTSSIWTSVSTAQTTTSATISGLNALTLYDWRVTTNCSSGSSTASAAQFTTSANTGCQSAYDVSTNGTISGAAVIPFNTSVTGLISPSGDLDYYKFTITNSGTITITLTTLPKDYDLKLVNSAGTQLKISQKAGTNNETINYTAAVGTYYAEVYGYNNNNSATSCYTLKVALGTASKSADAEAGNSKKVFSVFPNPAQTKINVNLADYKGTSQLQLFDVHGRQVAGYRTAQANSQMDISKLANGVYLLKIITESGEVLTSKVIKE